MNVILHYSDRNGLQKTVKIEKEGESTAGPKAISPKGSKGTADERKSLAEGGLKKGSFMNSLLYSMNWMAAAPDKEEVKKQEAEANAKGANGK